MPPKETKCGPSEYSYVTDEEEEHAPAPASAAPPRTPPRVVGTAAKSRVHVPNTPPSESSSERRAPAGVPYPPSADVPPAPERPKTERAEGPGRAGRTSRADAVAVAGGRTAASAVAAAPRTAEAPAEPDDAAPPCEAREQARDDRVPHLLGVGGQGPRRALPASVLVRDLQHLAVAYPERAHVAAG